MNNDWHAIIPCLFYFKTSESELLTFTKFNLIENYSDKSKPRMM